MGISTQRLVDTTYHVRGSEPKLLILSGTHGDETEVTDCVTRYIDTHQSELPDYVYIPELSPTAVKLKTRRNLFGHDLNREFIHEPIDPEVITAMKILDPFTFSLCIAFHEDPDRRTSFYMYDSHILRDTELLEYRQLITQTDAKLFTGIDDPADGKLALHVERGYIHTPILGKHDTGFSMRWLIEDHKAQRVFNPEIPGKADMDLKQRLVDMIFEYSIPFVS
ncbi:MAG: hypothetical protein AAB492_03320 [Patescibacteria group bacterium]